MKPKPIPVEPLSDVRWSRVEQSLFRRLESERAQDDSRATLQEAHDTRRAMLGGLFAPRWKAAAAVLLLAGGAAAFGGAAGVQCSGRYDDPHD